MNLFMIVAALLAAMIAATADNACANGTLATCGKSSQFCAQACVWDSRGDVCQQVFDRYPMPQNNSLSALGDVGSPLTQDNLNIFFYGDSITWLNKFEPLIQSAIQNGAGTSKLENISIVNQGQNGGTVKGNSNSNSSSNSNPNPSPNPNPNCYTNSNPNPNPKILSMVLLHGDVSTSNGQSMA